MKTVHSMSHWISRGVERGLLRSLRAAFHLLILGMAGLPVATQATGEAELLLLAVRLNGIAVGDAIWMQRLPDGRLAANAEDLRAWRLKFPGQSAQVSLDEIPGLSQRLDPASQTLWLTVPPEAFEASSLSPAGPGVPIQTAGTGGFFNYDLLMTQAGGRAGSTGLFEFGLFNRWGSGNLTALWNSDSPYRQLVRLDTTWTLDFPERMQSLRLGDAISNAGSWGRAFRFGGLQWGRNFATQPGFIPFALPAVRGAATLPSSVEVYVDNVRRMEGEVPAGPFDLANVPVTTGLGEMQLAVRDQLGRQQIVRLPYYVSPALLKPGLHDFSVEFGSLREDYGIEQARYRGLVLVANDRLGVSPGFTREFRVELQREQQTLGGGGVWLLPRVGTVGLNAAASHGPDGNGLQYGAAFERQARDISFGLRMQYAERGFVQLGTLPGARPRHSLAANVGLPAGSGTLALSYIWRKTWEGEENRVVSASYSLRVGRSAQLGLYALRSLGDTRQTSLGLVLSMAFDERTSGSLDFSAATGMRQGSVQVQRSLPAGEGYGYRLLAGLGDSDRLQAGGVWQTAQGTLTAEVAHAWEQTAYRAGISGGVATAGGGVFFSRRIDDSFAIVKVGDYAGVRVTRDNQEVGRTDRNGMILVTRLRPYQANPIGVEQADLPLDVEVDSLQLKLTPALRSGVVADFPVRRGRGASFRLVDESGAALPPGSRFRVVGRDVEFALGYDGVGFVNGLKPNGTFALEADGRCRAEAALDDGPDPLPDLGTLICRRMGE